MSRRATGLRRGGRGDGIETETPSHAELAALIAARDPIAAARVGTPMDARPIRVTHGGPPEGWLVDGDREGAIDAHRAAHAEGRESEAAVAYGAGVPPEHTAARLLALAELARATGRLRAVCPVPSAEGDAERPGSWGVEDLTVVAVARLVLPADVAVLAHWRRLGAGAVQVATAFGVSAWRIPNGDMTDPERLAAAIGRATHPRHRLG